MRSLSTEFLEKEQCYDGHQLAPHWIYKNHGLLGNALVAWVGPADVPVAHMVDLEDVRGNAPIGSPRMLHLIGEWFHDSLELAVAYQLLLVVAAREELEERGVHGVRRRGNDLYVRDKKLSVSIATRSPVSVLAHWGFNVHTAGTPVPTAGLAELGIAADSFAHALFHRFSQELEGMQKARCKVMAR